MIIKEQEDTELIQNISNGNKQAETLLYEKYKIAVKNFLKSKYTLNSDIDDDVSEIMIKVFMNLNTFDPEKSKFSSWVFGIAKNHMIDKWRSTGNSTTISINSLNISYTSALDSNVTLTTSCNTGFLTSSNMNCLSYSSNTAYSEFENCSSVSYLSSQLSPADFTMLDMKYVQGYDYNEIGKEFNVTSSTVSNRVNYIKTKLKKNNTEFTFD